MWGLIFNQCSAKMESVRHVMGAEKSHSFHETKDMAGLWQEEHNGCLFFPDWGWSSLGFFGLLLCFCFAPAFKDENVVSDACQRAEEIHEKSWARLAPR